MSEIRLSVSKCKTFVDCQAKYNFAYIQKLPRKEYSFHILGKLVHRVFEMFHAEYINGINDPYHIIMSKVYKTALDEYKNTITQEIKKEAWDIINIYLKKITEDKKTNKLPNVLAVEKSFNLEVSIDDTLVILNGCIDRIQIDPDGIMHVCDYKTTKNKKYLKNDFFQLATYSYIILAEDPTLTKIRGSYILLRHNCEYITKEFSIEDILSIKDKYIEYAQKIAMERSWKANPTPLCQYCDFLEQCDIGRSLYGAQTNGEVSW